MNDFNYESLLSLVGEITSNVPGQRNLKSALTQWLSCFQLSFDSSPEQSLWNNFSQSLGLYRDFLKARNLSVTTCNSRITLMRSWRSLYAKKRVTLDQPTDLAGCLEHAIRERGTSVGALAKSINVSHRTIRAWTTGLGFPARVNEDKVANIETILRLPARTLTKKLTCCYGDLAENSSGQTTAYRAKLRGRRGVSAYLRDAPESFRLEWQDFVIYKTGILPRGVRRSTSWRTKPKDSTPDRYSWAATIGNRVCPTAELNYDRIASIFGYLTGSADKNLRAMPASMITLANLADSNLIIQYLEYHRDLNGAYNGTTTSILQTVCNMVRPNYGYLWQNETTFRSKFWKQSLVPDEAAWKALCEETYFHLNEVRRSLKASGQIQQTRDPCEPIQAILDLQHPISVLFQLADAMAAMTPPKNWGSKLASYKRDLLLIKMLTVNPLRMSNYCIMTYRNDNAGNLFQKPDGAWWLRFKPEDFKNQQGAAKTPYLVQLSNGVWKDIEEYLSLYRPLLSGADMCDYMFRPRVRSLKEGPQTRMMTPGQLGVQLQKWTHRFIPNCPGFRGHAIRHLVATDFIKNHPQSFMIAASILHDNIQTVMENYAHLKKSDDFDVYNEYVAELREKTNAIR